MRALSFFAGIGGFDLGLEGLIETVGWVEIDPYCREVLRRRFPGAVESGEDIRATEPVRLPEAELWMGGFPCQGVSAAGTGLGLEDPRSGLWRVWARLIQARRPRWVFIENSPRLRTRGLAEVLGDLAAAGYDARWLRWSAWDAGAWHWRERVWVLAGPKGSWTAPGLFGFPLDHALGPDGVMVGGKHFDMPAVTSGKPREGLALPTASTVEYGSSANGVLRHGGVTPSGVSERPGPCAGAPSIFTLARRGMLPTATAGDASGAGSRNLPGSKAHAGVSLTDALVYGGSTRPRLTAAAARDVRSGKGRQENGHAPQLPEVLGGVINPDWEDAFMGFPVGWTDIDRDEPLELDYPGAWLDGSWLEAAGSPVLPPRSGKHRRKRVHALGNAVVPQAARGAWQRLTHGLTHTLA